MTSSLTVKQSGPLLPDPTVISSTSKVDSAGSTSATSSMRPMPTIVPTSTTGVVTTTSPSTLSKASTSTTMTTTRTTNSQSASSAISSTTSLSTTTLLTSTTMTTTTLTTTTTTTTYAASTTSPLSVPLDEYIAAILRHHNIHRTNHSASPLTWSTTLASTAQKIAQSCYYAHDVQTDGGGYGQNIGAGYLPTAHDMGSLISEGFYNFEEPNYVAYGAEPDLNTLSKWGHFTQVVWKSTSVVGCYTANCTAQGLANVGPGVLPYFTVCNYEGPGNYVGQFAANVGAPLGLPTVYADY